MDNTKTHQAGERTLCPNCGHNQDGADPTHCLDCQWPLTRNDRRAPTPAPWGIGRAGYATTIEDKYGNTIAELNNYGAAFLPAGEIAPHQLVNENAALIAAAPLLLEALEGLVADAESDSDADEHHCPKITWEGYMLAKNAITKAIGGAS